MGTVDSCAYKVRGKVGWEGGGVGEEGTQHYPPTPKDPHKCIFVSDITLLGVPTNDFSGVASEEALTHCVKTSHLFLGGCFILAGEGHHQVHEGYQTAQFMVHIVHTAPSNVSK